MKYLLRTISLFCVGILLLSTGIASAHDLSIGNYTVVSKTRVSRTEYEYTYHADITNIGSDAQNATATLTSNSPHTIVVHGTLSFGDVASGKTVTSADTFTVRQNRQYPLDWSDLGWDIHTVSDLRIKDVTPSAALPGATVTLTFSGNTNSEPLQAVLGSQVVSTTPVAGRTDAVTFEVPTGARSAPLYLKQGERSSNAVWFSVSDISVATPAREDIVLNELGNKVVVNMLIISMNEEFDNIEEAQRVADLQSGLVVGQLPLIAGYQVKLNTKTLDELDAAVAIFEADPAVDFVMIDVAMANMQSTTCETDWPTELPEDPGDRCYNVFLQRLSNGVKEGAELYRERVNSSDLDKVHPIFTSIGLIENGIDYDAADFDRYAYRGTARPNNIAIYAGDVDGNATEEAHGTTVTGIVAAELGDGNKETGKNAGLLHALGNNHGGFNISVGRENLVWPSGYIDATYKMLAGGATVINWSFGSHKQGAKNTNGAVLDDESVVSEEEFESLKKAFEKVLTHIQSQYPQAVIVAAAGNSDTQVSPNFSVPGGIPSESMIIVGAHDYEDYDPFIRRFECRRFEWSDYGARVDIAAAGRVPGSNGVGLHGDGFFGTSYAAPLVTATIAAVQSINPDLSPKDVLTLLRSSALPIVNEVNLSSGVTAGFTKPLTSDEVGEGDPRVGQGARLNVKGAVDLALESVKGKTVPTRDLIEVQLTTEVSNVTIPVGVTVPSGSVFDKVDILFLVDVSGSYGNDIIQFKNQAVDIVNAFRTAGTNVQIGVATFSDFPIPPYGYTYAGDYAYRLNQPLTPDPDTVITAISGITLHYGGDGAESQLEALYQAATGAGRTVAGYPNASIEPSAGGWRSGALPIIFLATDAAFHNSDSEPIYPGAGWAETLSALTSRKIQVYGLQSGGSISDVLNIVSQTGGESFTLSSNSAEIVTAVLAALQGASQSVHIKLVKNGDFSGLIESISPEQGYADVMPGQTKTFNVTFLRDWFDPFADYVFSLRLQVIAEEVAVIEEIPVTVHVQP
ncbi:MAG: S8 family serine peptidase [Pseudomonadota bacterium]